MTDAPMRRDRRQSNSASEERDPSELHRWSLPQGRVLRRVLRDDPGQEYLAYIPSSGAVAAPILASVHGLSRNAHEQAVMFAPYCERFGVVLVAPRYTPEHHSDYQRLGRKGRGVRADQVLEECVAEVASLSGADATQFSLFGYSGGAQFAHRYVMARPHRVSKAAIVAAGWYTFPDHRHKYPYGIRPSRRLPDIAFNPEDFLYVPVDVFVGERDIISNNLRQTERVRKQQGKNRVERARNWVTAMQEACVAHKIEPTVTLTVVPRTDHSFTTFCKRGALVRRVFRSLFQVDIDPPAKVNQELMSDLELSAEKLLKKLSRRSTDAGSKQIQG